MGLILIFFITTVLSLEKTKRTIIEMEHTINTHGFMSILFININRHIPKAISIVRNNENFISIDAIISTD
jgi:hypothetical protein